MIKHESDIAETPMAGEGIVGVTKRIAVGPQDGYDGYMRVFTIQAGGHTPYHAHPWFHTNYVLEGEGKVVLEGTENPVKAGSVAYIEGGKKHQFVNTGTAPLRFICLVPAEGDKY